MASPSDPPALPASRVRDDDRLGALATLGLWGSAPEGSFDEMVRLAANLFEAPVALFSLVGPDRQFVKSEIGLADALDARRQMPLARSLCQHVVAGGRVLAVADAAADERAAEAVAALGLGAYLGAPIRGPRGEPLGALAVADRTPRAWTGEDLRAIAALATAVEGLVRVRFEVGLQRMLKAVAREAERHADQPAWIRDAVLLTLSHELRTPLVGILGNADLLDDLVGPDLADYVGGIRRGGERLLRTLSSILDLALVEAGAFPLVLEPVRVAERARLAAAAAEGLAAPGVRLAVEAPAEGAVARADWRALDRVLGHVVENALKFTEAGKVHVRVWAEADAVAVEVADTGIGVPEAFLPNLFDPFAQADEGEARLHEGCGVGLAIARRLVDQMGGTIAVASAEGEGSRFTVRLPRADG